MSENMVDAVGERTPSEKVNKGFKLKRIKDKLMAIVIIIVVSFTLIASVVISQNAKTQKILSSISALRIPVPILTADIISGANRVSASQRAYLMTGDDKYKKERLTVWAEQINPSAERLDELKTLLKVEEHRQIVDKAIEQLDYYEHLQQEIDEFFEKELKSLDLTIDQTDSASLMVFAEKVKMRNSLDTRLDNLVAVDASRARKELRRILRPLNQAQEELLIQDSAKVNSRLKTTTTVMILASLVAIFLTIGLSRLLFKSLKRSIHRPTKLLTAMARGHLPEKDSRSEDELNDIFQATNRLSANMKKASLFALDVGQGNFDHDFSPASEEDNLGNALVGMRDRLRNVAEDDRKRKWVTEGLARFADLLRSDVADVKTLCETIISNLAKYTGANQGSIFTISADHGSSLELQSCYAWERIKYLEKTIKPGEGLTGQAWLEGDKIYMEDLPDNFIQIRSGLGEANPTSLLIIPIKTESTIEGMLELAFFQKLPSHYIEFIEKLCSNMAATLSAVKINQRTQQLLEQSQQQAEELRAQEEEMRQNMEELTATQEEMNRKDIEMRGQVDAISRSVATAEFDLRGYVTNANSKFLDLIGYDLEDARDKSYKFFVDEAWANSEEYSSLWRDLNNGLARTHEVKVIRKNGTESWLAMQFNPVFNKAHQPVRVVVVASDVTEEKSITLKFENYLDAVNSSVASVEFDLRGSILASNSLFRKIMLYENDELEGLHHNVLIEPGPDHQQFWKDLSNGKIHSGEFKYLTKLGREIWLSGAYVPMMDEERQVYKIINFALDITAEKMKLLEYAGEVNAINTAMSAVELALDGTIINANHLFLHAMGYSLAEIKGKNHRMFLDKSYAESRAYKAFWQALVQGKPQTGDITLYTKHGSPLKLTSNYAPVRNDRGEVTKIINFAQAVTEVYAS